MPSAPREPTAAPPGVRRRPVQRRGVETMELIVDSARLLLAERGLDGFTTNAIAQRANVNIATLYAYFADKQAILWELAHRYEERRSLHLEDLPRRFADGEDWRTLLVATLDQLVQLRRDQPGVIELRRAIASTPELRQLDRERDERVAGALARGLGVLAPHADPVELRTVARTIIVSGSHLIDLACSGDEVDEELLAGYRHMVRTYLEDAMG